MKPMYLLRENPNITIQCSKVEYNLSSSLEPGSEKGESERKRNKL